MNSHLPTRNFFNWFRQRAGFWVDLSKISETLVPHSGNSDIWCSPEIFKQSLNYVHHSLRALDEPNDRYYIVAILAKDKQRFLYFSWVLSPTHGVFLELPLPKRPNSPKGLRAIRKIGILFKRLESLQEEFDPLGKPFIVKSAPGKDIAVMIGYPLTHLRSDPE